MKWLLDIANAFNAVRSNVWSVVLVFVGIYLVVHGHPQEGSGLITGAFAVFRSGSGNTDTPTQPSQPTDKPKQ